MKRGFSLFLLVLIAGFQPAITGCAWFQSPNQTLVRSFEGGSQTILEEYEKYVINREPLPNVQPDDLKERWQDPRNLSVKKLRELIAEAKDE